MLTVNVPYPIRDCAEQYYNEAIIDLAGQVFMLPFYQDLGKEPADLHQANIELEQIIKDMSDVFDIPIQQITEDIDAAMTRLPIVDMETSVNLRKLNLLN